MSSLEIPFLMDCLYAAIGLLLKENYQDLKILKATCMGSQWMELLDQVTRFFLAVTWTSNTGDSFESTAAVTHLSNIPDC